MKRREFIHSSLVVSATALAPTQAAPSARPLPRRDRIRVAFLLGPDTNVIDTAGPWEVFQDVMVMKSGTHTNPFELVTVGPSRDPLTMTAGLVVTPRFTFADAPPANVVVVPAQRAGDAARAWLRERAAHADMVMSVCTGAYQLARTGLLDGLAATTHHDFWDDFAREFPAVRLQRGARFVDNGHIASAGGLTSGIDLALHVV
ncbi:MAG TPA: DJ-1/PfpI family protein, partial [Steroidobacteraceae bacterium]|nr:DJ-1/PfpI family protein [Steroidobacteraceae bacterium]